MPTKTKTASRTPASRPVRVPSEPQHQVSARPVRTLTATIKLDGYSGWTAEMQSNVPLRVLDDLDRTTEFDVMRGALVALVVSHTFPLANDLNLELTAEEVWALRRAYIAALNAAAAPSKSN